MAELDLTSALFALADGYDENGEKRGDHTPSGHGSRSPSRSRSPRSRSMTPRSRSFSPRSRSGSRPRSYRSPSPYSRSPAKVSRAESSRRRDDSASVEEGEALSAPGSPHSLGSVAMDESDSEASDAESTSAPRVSHDPLVREQQLAALAEKKEERERMDQLKGLFNENDRIPRTSKRKLDSGIDEERRNIRQRTAKKELDGRKREKKSTHSRRSASSDFGGDSKATVDPPADLIHYQRIRVGRSNFAQICFDPFFEDRIVGCFTRVCFSRDPTTGENIYRMCEIRGFKRGKPYQLQGTGDRTYMTDQYIIAGYGKIEKEYPLVACSDSKFTQTEFDRWKHAISAENLRQLPISSINHKIEDINYLLNHSWTSVDLQKKLDNQNRLAHLIRQNKAAAVGPETLRREEALHRRNVENRRQNERDVHAALLRERMEKKMRNEKIRKEMEEDAKTKNNPDKWEEQQEKKRRDEELAKKLGEKYVKKAGNVMEFARVRTDDEVIGSLDLDIDVDIC